MSIRLPGCTKGGMVAATKTAAMFEVRMLARFEANGRLMPIRSRVSISVWVGKTVWVLSPVPCSPTTSP